MTENDRRYGRNRNQWKRTYPYTNRKPRIVEIADAATDGIITLDLSRTVRHRDYFKLTAPGKNLENLYEEGLLFFVGGSSLNGSFRTSFIDPPFVTYVLQTSTGSVSVFGTSTPTKFFFPTGLSAPFSGSIKYFAVAPAGDTTPFPRFIDVGGIGGNTGSFWIYAGTASLDSTQTEFTASYSIPVGTLSFRIEGHDINGLGVSNVAFELDALSTTQATGRISAPINDSLHFHVTSE